MRCVNPYSVKDPEYNNPRIRIKVACNQCFACMQTKAVHWSIRLQEELKVSESAYFLTFTYAPEHLYVNENGEPSVLKDHLQLYMKRIRKVSRNKLRYYAISEYGGKFGRPHYHMILFNLHGDDLDEICKMWCHGNVQVSSLNEARIRYVANYHTLKFNKPNEKANDTFVLMSRRPGIGSNYVDRMKDYHTDDYFDQKSFYAKNDLKLSLPKYYKDKLYDDFHKKHFSLSAEKYEIESWQDYRRRESEFKSDILSFDEMESQQLWSDYRAHLKKLKDNQKL